MKSRKVKKKRADIENETFLSSSIDNAHDMPQQDRCVPRVKVPYFFTVSIQVKAGIYTSGKDKGKPIYATQDIISKEPFPEEWIIEKFVPVTLQFTNKCPKCANTGTPRIDKKHMGNFGSYKKYPSNQEEQYRLIYFHTQEDNQIKPCIIARFGKHGIFTKTGKISKTVEDYIFPNYIIKNI
ncbi:MAG: hypothetical protein COA77_00885 [Thaumarchaeota archaeon]|nr:MAG: hypothetical protein COA77_00885 [Nitrososphaerota archaeon]